MTSIQRTPGARVSVVLPVCNEAALLPALYQHLTTVLASEPYEYRLIFVNDGSQDDTLRILKDFHQRDARVMIISFTRNFGHQMALSAGLRYAQGDAVILMDADLQDPPEILPKLLAKWADGWDVVYAVRTKRKEPWHKRIAYATFYRILGAVTHPSIPLDAGDFSLLSRRAVNLINDMPERSRFIRGLRSWIGVRHTHVEFERDRRAEGQPKYTLWKLVLLALDGLVAFSHVPLRLASTVGFLCAGLGAAGILTFLYFRLFTTTFIPGYTSIILAVLFMGSIQLITIGILGEYIARIYDEVKQRPLYIIDEIVGFPTTPRVTPDTQAGAPTN